MTDRNLCLQEDRINVLEILTSYNPIAKDVVNRYNENEKLNGKDRNIIVDAIIDYAWLEKIKISLQLMSHLSIQICKICPAEIPVSILIHENWLKNPWRGEYWAHSTLTWTSCKRKRGHQYWHGVDQWAKPSELIVLTKEQQIGLQQQFRHRTSFRDENCV